MAKLLNEPVSDEQAEEWGRTNLGQMREIVEKLTAMLPEGYRDYVIDDGNSNEPGAMSTGRLPTSLTISFLDGTVTIHPEAIERKCIGGVREFPGWHVTEWKFYPATYHEPEDCSDSLLCETPNALEAVGVAVSAIFKVALSNCSEMLQTAQFVEEEF